MIFMDIPEEVIFDHIFPFLELNDLLRLRGVNKILKPLAQDYLQLHHTSKRYFAIDIFDDGTSSLSALFDLNYVAPLSKFYIGNLKNKTFEHEVLHEFVEIYGNKVTHLQLNSLEIPVVSRKAIRFFEALPNLEYLEIYVLEERSSGSKKAKKMKAMALKNEGELAQLIPATFRSLRTLMIHAYECIRSPLPLEESEGLVWKFIEECSPHLEYLRHPEIVFDIGRLSGRMFENVLKLLEGGSLRNLKVYDLERFLQGDVIIPLIIHDFYKLVTACARLNVKLLNVNGLFIEGMMRLETNDMEEHGRKISKVVVSMQNLHESSFFLEFPHLEKITIGPDAGTWGNCTMPDEHVLERQAWSNLKDLQILIDSDELYNSDWMDWEDVDTESVELLNYFFVGIRREKMEKLSLKFHPHLDAREDILPYPRVIDICRSCPNLKELTLSEWPGSNRAISKLWGNLPLLEKVRFDQCYDLGNVAFVGEDKENPELLKAKNLRSLTLERFDIMPKITDTLFSLVLRNMPLKELHLLSYRPISNSKITLAGISSLLGGVFSETIEKLWLDFRMEGVSAEEMKAVANQFRSSQM